MAIDAAPAGGLTPKGARTRARIVDAAAVLIHDHGVAATTIEDVRAAAEVSGSQLYHYFTDKSDLVEAVIDRQADAVVTTQERAELGTVDGLRRWRDLVIAHAGSGGCPLGSLGAQVAETDDQGRAHVAAGLQRWATAISDRLRAAPSQAPLAGGIDPDDLAVTLLAVLQGGLLLTQVQRDTRPLATALDTVLTLAAAASPHR